MAIKTWVSSRFMNRDVYPGGLYRYIEVQNLFAGRAQHPVTRALEPFRETFGLSAARLNEIIDGMEMDLRQSRYLDWKGLEGFGEAKYADATSIVKDQWSKEMKLHAEMVEEKLAQDHVPPELMQRYQELKAEYLK